MKLDRRFLNISFCVYGVANSPADNPTAGTQYIVGATPTGDFASAVANSIAYYDGTAWSFNAPSLGDSEVLNISTKEILRYNGSTWIVVTSIGSGIKSFSGRGKVQGTAPGGSTSTSEQYLNTTTAKLHNGTDDGGWDDGVEVSEGFSFYSDSDHKIYTYKDSQFISTDLEDKELLFNTTDKVLYIHYLNGNVHGLYRVDHSKLTVIRETVGASLLSGKEIFLQNLDTMYLDEVQVFVSGLLQMPGVDYEINQYNMLSWKNFALKDIIKMGDVITVYYMMQA